MSVSPAKGIKDIIAAAALAELNGFTLFVSVLAESTAPAIAFLDQPGSPPETIVGLDYPSVQVLARGTTSSASYEATRAAIDAIYRHLHLLNPATQVQYTELVSCLASTGIAPLGNDDKNRPRFSGNFRLITQPADPGNRM